MRFTSDDIRDQRFKTKFWGLDKEDVKMYLQLVADDFEDFQAEAAELKEQLEKRNEIVEKLKDRDRKLRNRIEVLLKKRGSSSNEADVKKGNEIIQNALNRAKEIKDLTEQEAYKMEKEIMKLEEHKKRLMESIKS